MIYRTGKICYSFLVFSKEIATGTQIISAIDFEKHPLYSRGLRQNNAYEIRNSVWKNAFSSNPQDASTYSARKKHYAYCFKDKMIEVIGEKLTVCRSDVSSSPM